MEGIRTEIKNFIVILQQEARPKLNRSRSFLCHNEVELVRGKEPHLASHTTRKGEDIGVYDKFMQTSFRRCPRPRPDLAVSLAILTGRWSYKLT